MSSYDWSVRACRLGMSIWMTCVGVLMGCGLVWMGFGWSGCRWVVSSYDWIGGGGG